MLSIKDAVERAVTFARGMLDLARLDDPRLEEVESGTMEGKQAWVITLSFRDKEIGFKALTQDARTYKRFWVDKQTGDVISMKIREMVGA